MNTKPSPSRYRNCISRRSTMARPTLTPALNVRSTTAPVLTFRSFVRTKAPPLPGFTCWNSITWNRVPSSSSVIPFFKSLVETLTWLLRWWAGIGSRRPKSRGGRDVASRREEVLTRPREGPAPVHRHLDHVLDPDPAHTGKVHARLHRHDGAGRERVLAPSAKARPLVDLETHPVAQAVGEVLAEAGGLDHRTGRGIHLGSGGPHPYRVDACLVSRAHQFVDVTEPVRGLAERHGPGHVGVVPVNKPPEVHLHDVAPRKRPAGRFVMRLGRVLPERHDRVERRTRRPGPAQLGLELERQLALAHTVPEPSHDGIECLVGGTLSPLKGRELVRVLHPSLALDLAPHRDELDPLRRGPELLVGPERDPFGFEPESPYADAPGGPHHRLEEPVQVRDPLQVGDLVAGLLGVAAVGEEGRTVRGQEHLAVGPGEPRHVPDVGQPGEEEPVRSELGQPGGEPGAPQVVIHGSASIAR